MCFSKRLKQLREEEGLSQEKLADKLEIPRTSISHYESDIDRIPREKRLYLIADFFNVSVDYLLGRSDTKKLTHDETDFVGDTRNLTIEELTEKYRLTVDGKSATKEEIEGAIAFIRSLREMK